MTDPCLIYRPSSGTEGMDFISEWCARCRGDENEDCPILAASFVGEVSEWRYERGEPVCSAFEPSDPTDLPFLRSAAVADLFPASPRRPTQGEQVRMLVSAQPPPPRTPLMTNDTGLSPDHSTVELLPCPNPWCESHERPERGYHPFVGTREGEPGRKRVCCPVCPMQGPAGDTEAEAITAWNQRAAITALATPPEPPLQEPRIEPAPELVSWPSKWLRHDGLCGIIGGYDYCTCGLDEARAALTTLQEIPGGGQAKRECDVCHATVAVYDHLMCCHCQEVPWRVSATLPSDKPAEHVDGVGNAELRPLPTPRGEGE